MILGTDLEKKIRDKIGELEKEKTRLQDEFSEEARFADYAARAYGSELAGDVFDKGKQIRSDFLDVQAKIIVLNQVLEGKIDISKTTVTTLEDRISHHNQKIEDLRAQVRELEEEKTPDMVSMGLILNIKELLGIKNFRELPN